MPRQKEPSEQMLTAPLQTLNENCKVCKHLQDALAAEDLKQPQIGYLRHECSICKYGRTGIYKADIILSLAKRQILKGKGRSPVVFKRYGAAVKKLTDEGYSVRKIADMLSLSPTTVLKVRKELVEVETYMQSLQDLGD